MRAVIQRVESASVEVEKEIIGKIGKGLLILLGVTLSDTQADADYLVGKILNLRVFESDKSGFDFSVSEQSGDLLVVSQFTLYGSCSKGRRPDFTETARPEQAEKLYEYFVAKCRESGLNVETGRFGAHMQVGLINDGPVTIIIDSPAKAS